MMPNSRTDYEQNHLRIVDEDYLAELWADDEASPASIAEVVATIGYVSVLGVVELAEKFCPLRLAASLWRR